MPRRRLWTAVVGVLATVLVTAVAACSGSSGSSGAGSKPTITIWNDALAVGSCGVPAADSFLTKGVNMFLQANPGFNVKIAQVACDASPAFNTLLKSSEVAGTTPDIIQLYVGGQVIQNGKYLVPLNNYLPQSYVNSLTGWKYVTDGYQSKPNGSIYAVPYGAGYWYFVYYNKALFARAGISNPQPATWADLITLAKKLKAKGITPFDIGEKEGYVGAWTQDALISALVGDAGVLKMYSGAQSLDSSTLIQPYTAWHELFADGLTNSDAPSLTYSSGIAEFAAGKAAMNLTGGFYNSQFMKGLGSNVGLFPIPVLPGSQFPKSLSGGPNNAYSIFKTSKYVADDIKLIKFLTSLKVQELSVNELGQLPNNVSFTPSAAFQAQQPLLTAQYKFINVDHYALGEAFDNIMPGTICSYWYQTNSAVFGGTLNPSGAASSMQSQMKNYLATASSG
ncbi:MAG TPA: extracellular solute-binding protein [Streptosporangiaceae bacterium]|nr:extracellular solute-binding protein [Streptosporangiaceae bacterium]